MVNPVPRFKNIRKHTKTLLSHGEGHLVDFKQRLKGLDSADLVAFANSKDGGTILIGVEEVESPEGLTIGKIYGCDVSDHERLTINNLALTCSPPIPISISIENLNHLPIFRIDIPSSKLRPHCTGKGTYAIRVDNRNAPLAPSALLEMFMESEASQFLDRFQSATVKLESKLEEINSSIDEQLEFVNTDLTKSTHEFSTMLDNLALSLSELHEHMLSEVAEIREVAHDASSQNYDLEDNSKTVLTQVEGIYSLVSDTRADVMSLLQHFGIESETGRQMRMLLTASFKMDIKNNGLTEAKKNAAKFVSKVSDGLPLSREAIKSLYDNLIKEAENNGGTLR